MKTKFVYFFNSLVEYDLFEKNNFFLLPRHYKENINDMVYIGKNNILNYKGIVEKIIKGPILMYSFLPENLSLKKNIKDFIINIPFLFIEDIFSLENIFSISLTENDKKELKKLLTLKNHILKNNIKINSNFFNNKTLKEFSDLLVNISLSKDKEFILINNLTPLIYKPSKTKFPYKNIIFYGPPGTGKTLKANQLALDILNSDEKDKKDLNFYMKNNQIEFCIFHPSFSYEDFIEGLKSDGKGNFVLNDGILKRLVNKAHKNLEQNFVLILDEINRGDVSKIFGEIITLIEEDKRTYETNSLEVLLPYSKEKFSIPSNLYIIGTMNSSDKSIGTLDLALRRRFLFEEISPSYNLLTTIEEIDLNKLLLIMNQRIEYLYDKNHLLGHSYFFNINSLERLKNIFYNKIIPLLEEYFYEDLEKVGLVLGGIGKNQREDFFIYKENINLSQLFKKNIELFQYEDKKIFRINKNFNKKMVLNIYE